jgi:hypothetical protein
MTLTNPTDQELNWAFAEKVCGYFQNPIFKSNHSWCRKSSTGEIVVLDGLGALPSFTTSADAVLPWLEKQYVETGLKNYWSHSPAQHFTSEPKIWQIRAFRGNLQGIAESTTFPRACVIALLRAHGVEVNFI